MNNKRTRKEFEDEIDSVDEISRLNKKLDQFKEIKFEEWTSEIKSKQGVI
ncbi:hypothetical protein DICPUDRAFT_158991 [Dictyostelium purpureum]|uniref:Uncharacterized protein n=1 Tax=Dictyostelium purpureum TaxID=5786 RepID=F1A300_DICPU|nr:uncharacterized protein DICPUDRAFT_158991 [Dictyostelium purpureum]EGC29433.1 hypothetical protein DICPUDRAFT_158991 [Dictyostelium purpureum]|eukprot:XP_003294044.1 hypothetical protein DICPUDRAFT_158991 [Dictyostelium purpureum]